MKINRDMVTRAGLALLHQHGLEHLTLRRLADALHIQAPTLYWHFRSKEDLLDEMATTVLAEGAPVLLPSRRSAPWPTWVSTFAHGLRSTLLTYRDGARMVSGTRLTSTSFLHTTETLGNRLLATGFTPRSAVVLVSTVYNYTLSFTMEEQAVFPIAGERSPRYVLADRRSRLDPALFPFHRRATPILFDNFDRRFREGLRLILRGASPPPPPPRPAQAPNTSTPRTRPTRSPKTSPRPRASTS